MDTYLVKRGKKESKGMQEQTKGPCNTYPLCVISSGFGECDKKKREETVLVVL
jgi:hypothetical protein